MLIYLLVSTCLNIEKQSSILERNIFFKLLKTILVTIEYSIIPGIIKSPISFNTFDLTSGARQMLQNSKN